ncbi:transposase [Sphingomonas naphthae]|uniref:Transposase n=1 Tax=Sphingomonas naphthae TaxID=1813468 RepID=A0ABY7TPR4_9SPHN|nr:transposase [Sphingomonas naphthae]WCT74976.1 transposase [Sphingomonas naphthae]
MPRVIAPAEASPAIDLDTFLGEVERAGFDPRCEDSFASLGPALGQLGADRAFLGDRLVDLLTRDGAGQGASNPYGAQVVMLHRGDGWFVRANIWPAAHEAAMRASGPRPFFYGVPHDHNFSFLTVGYFGPGYWSDYWDYDHGAVAGFTGEPAGLRFVERSRLSPGRILLYRAHRDVHSQHPPDSVSVSLNLMQQAPGQGWRDQYRFDVETGTVDGIVSAQAAEGLVALLPALGGAEGMDLLDRFAKGHPSQRIRFGCIEALAGAAADFDATVDIYARATRASDPFVSGMARHRLGQIEQGAAWRRKAAP